MWITSSLSWRMFTLHEMCSPSHRKDRLIGSVAVAGSVARLRTASPIRKKYLESMVSSIGCCCRKAPAGYTHGGTGHRRVAGATRSLKSGQQANEAEGRAQ